MIRLNSMLKLKKISLSQWILALLIVSMVLFNKLMPILTLCFSLSLIWDRANKDMLKDRIKSPSLVLFAFFILHIIGATYSSNKGFAYADIGMKASFAIFPVIFLLSGIRVNERFLKNSVLVGLVLSLILCEVNAFINYLNFPSFAYFRDSYFSILMHRSYFGMYLFVGLVLSAFEFLKNKSIKNIHLWIALFLAMGAIQTFSKIAILLTASFLVSFVVYLIFKSKNKLITLIIGAGILAIFTFGISSSDYLVKRLEIMVSSFNGEKDVNSVESNNARLVMWETSMNIIAEHPIIGVGTGDIKDVLVTKLEENKSFALAEKRLNSHNQFLNTGVALGFIGMFTLILWFSCMIFSTIRRKLYSWVVVIISFIFAFLTESFLETQAGIMPVSLLFTIIVIMKADNSVYNKLSNS